MEQTPNSIFELLSSKSFRSRPGLYIGEKKISILRAFIDGYFYAAEFDKINSDRREKFAEFHDWVANYFGWNESTAGWKNIILEECNGDEEIAVDKFFEVYDKFIENQD